MQYKVPESLTAMSVRLFLQKHAGISLTLWRRIKRSESFCLNGQSMNPALTIVHPGDIISYELNETTSILPLDMPLDIRYEDDCILVINKPAGQLVHPSNNSQKTTLANAVLYHYQDTHQTHGFHPVHRLDRRTSGLVLIAKLPQIQHQLTTGSDKLFERRYLALISGQLLPATGTIDMPIARRPGSIIERMVAPNGQKAITHYHTLQTTTDLSLLELTLETGRTHQIRVHLAYKGHPLLGDDLYGGCCQQISRQALHAWKLQFTHPVTGKNIQITAPLPDDMTHILSSFSKT